MKKIIICVCNDIEKDDRVLKKAMSLSTIYDVKVISIVTKKPNKNKINFKIKNVTINKIYLNKYNRYLKKHILSSFFWKRIVKKNSADIYDCNDPDTIMAGIWAKKLYDSKIIYDSHEYWKDKYPKNNLKNIFNYYRLSKTLYYFYEKPFIKYFDKVITVSDKIKEKLIENYKLDEKKVVVIYNFLNYFKLKKIKKENKVCFFGGSNRASIDENLTTIYNKFNLKPLLVGFKGNNPDFEYTGFLSKDDYVKKIATSKIALLTNNTNCLNVIYATPNKLFVYLQSEVPMIGYDLPGLNLIKKYKIGELCNNSKKDLIEKTKTILNNYDYYINNFLG
jgi:glycosyltransferase involved in cell wall biosynthesis